MPRIPYNRKKHYLCLTMILHPNAKINIGLRVLSRRKDGYHNLETIFYPIQLSDTLEITQTNTPGITFEQAGIPIDCAPEDNLIFRIAKALLERTENGGIHIRFTKNVPFGAGLGGGSSDAAHTALAINELFKLNLSTGELCEYVSKFGADCPFFILNTPCLATGIGDVLTPISFSLAGYHLVLIKPDMHVSTKVAYAGVTPMLQDTSLADLIRLPIEQWKDHIVNDFERSVFAEFPAIAAIKAQLYDLGAVYASMSGSGSSVFGIFPSTACPTLTDLQRQFQNTFIHTEVLR